MRLLGAALLRCSKTPQAQEMAPWACHPLRGAQEAEGRGAWRSLGAPSSLFLMPPPSSSSGCPLAHHPRRKAQEPREIDRPPWPCCLRTEVLTTALCCPAWAPHPPAQLAPHLSLLGN